MMAQPAQRDEVREQQCGEDGNRRTQVQVGPLEPGAWIADRRVAELHEAEAAQDVQYCGAPDQRAERPREQSVQKFAALAHL